MAVKLLFIFGTRPEAIKLAPLINMAKSRDEFEPIVCVTAQHRELLDQVMDFFNIKADYDLNLMKPNQTLFDITANALKLLKPVVDDCKPDLIIVHGDTTTSLVGAITGYYSKIPVAHIEAGLRTGDKFSPYPEEINRVLVGHVSDYHFSSTEEAKNNLLKENINHNIWVVGNTVIDALFSGLKLIESKEEEYCEEFKYIDFSKKIILVTGHRRENFGEPFEHICHALRDIAKEREDAVIVYPVHLNPNVREPVNRILKDIPNVHLIGPLDYPRFIWLMSKAHVILTDSGGIQEEAPSLGKPVLVMREKTERFEGIEAGSTKLVGCSRDNIVNNTINLLSNDCAYKLMVVKSNPYGDGNSSKKILDILKAVLVDKTEDGDCSHLSFH